MTRPLHVKHFATPERCQAAVRHYAWLRKTSVDYWTRWGLSGRMAGCARTMDVA